MRGGAQQQVDVSLNTVKQSILQCVVSRVVVEHSNLADWMMHELIKDRPKFNSANTGDTYAHMLIYMLYPVYV